jgi:hypothetical protein
MVATPAIRNLIREGKTHQIYSMLQAGGRYGMVTMDMSLAQLVKQRAASRSTWRSSVCERRRPPPTPERLIDHARDVPVQGPDKNGKLVEGSARGRERAARRQQAALDGLRAHRDPAAGRQSLQRELKIPFFSDRVKLKDVAVFSRQFATMINSGLSLLRSLNILAEQTESKPLAEIVNQVRLDVEKGSSLSQAMAKHPKAFNRSTSRWSAPVRSAVRSTACSAARRHDREAGRAAPQGQVGDDLPGRRRVPRAHDRHRDAAVRHPDVPGDLQAARRHAAAPTQILIDISNVVRKLWYIVFGVEIGGAFAFRKWINSEEGRKRGTRSS